MSTAKVKDDFLAMFR